MPKALKGKGKKTIRWCPYVRKTRKEFEEEFDTAANGAVVDLAAIIKREAKKLASAIIAEHLDKVLEERRAYLDGLIEKYEERVEMLGDWEARLESHHESLKAFREKTRLQLENAFKKIEVHYLLRVVMKSTKERQTVRRNPYIKNSRQELLEDFDTTTTEAGTKPVTMIKEEARKLAMAMVEEHLDSLLPDRASYLDELIRRYQVVNDEVEKARIAQKEEREDMQKWQEILDSTSDALKVYRVKARQQLAEALKYIDKKLSKY